MQLRNCEDGSFNVAVGDEAGTSIVHASNMVAIGASGAGPWADTSSTCFIGSIYNQIVSDPDSQQAVYVDQFDVVGIHNSSRKYKHDIQPMGKASESLYGLKPVTFKYNSDWKGVTQYGLIAEQVAELDPHLVAHGKDGENTTVHYEKVNAMLLNEFLKEDKKVEELQKTVAQQQKGMEVLTAQLKEQATQIQKVSAQLEMSNSAAKVAVNKP
jgi:endosialidase-like protein